MPRGAARAIARRPQHPHHPLRCRWPPGRRLLPSQLLCAARALEQVPPVGCGRLQCHLRARRHEHGHARR
eukprot:8505-Pleurochrysis_carterae.AAC.1